MMVVEGVLINIWLVEGLFKDIWLGKGCLINIWLVKRLLNALQMGRTQRLCCIENGFLQKKMLRMMRCAGDVDNCCQNHLQRWCALHSIWIDERWVVF